jgi:hypothetical protein
MSTAFFKEISGNAHLSKKNDDKYFHKKLKRFTYDKKTLMIVRKEIL